MCVSSVVLLDVHKVLEHCIGTGRKLAATRSNVSGRRSYADCLHTRHRAVELDGRALQPLPGDDLIVPALIKAANTVKIPQAIVLLFTLAMWTWCTWWHTFLVKRSS